MVEMLEDVIVEARGLEPPEPFQLVVSALEGLKAGQRVRFFVDREPHPLYRVLQREGYRYSPTLLDDGSYEIVIERRRAS